MNDDVDTNSDDASTDAADGATEAMPVADHDEAQESTLELDAADGENDRDDIDEDDHAAGTTIEDELADDVVQTTVPTTTVPADDASGRGLAIATLVIAGVLAFVVGAALGKGFAPSQSDAAIARIDARDAAKEDAHDEAYKAAYDEAFTAEKARGAAAGKRQGTIEGKRSGKAAAAKQAPTAAPTPAAVDCPSFDLGGIDYGSGAGYFDISVRGMQCQEAKNLILAAGFGGNFTGLQAHGWACQSLGSEGETSQYRCTDSRNRVFRWWAGA